VSVFWQMMQQANDTQDTDCVVIGAGIAGLLAAQALVDAGLRTMVLDKGRTVGGRMATRRLDAHRFDHGAQAISFHDPRLTALTDRWQEQEFARPCMYSPVAAATTAVAGPLCGVDGMSSIPKALASHLDVLTEYRVSQVNRLDTSWLVERENGERITARALIMTPPVPQSLDILRQSEVELPDNVTASLRTIRYDACIALMAGYDTSEPILALEFSYPDNGPVSLIVDNYVKLVSPVPGALTFHTRPDFAEEHWDASDDEITRRILQATPDLVPSSPRLTRVHRWRYSRTSQSHPDACVVVDSPGPLAFAGDGFAGEDIEGAMLSGLAAAEAILARLR